jgi:hypothetical protein
MDLILDAFHHVHGRGFETDLTGNVDGIASADAYPLGISADSLWRIRCMYCLFFHLISFG